VRMAAAHGRGRKRKMASQQQHSHDAAVAQLLAAYPQLTEQACRDAVLQAEQMKRAEGKPPKKTAAQTQASQSQKSVPLAEHTGKEGRKHGKKARRGLGGGSDYLSNGNPRPPPKKTKASSAPRRRLPRSVAARHAERLAAAQPAGSSLGARAAPERTFNVWTEAQDAALRSAVERLGLTAAATTAAEDDHGGGDGVHGGSGKGSKQDEDVAVTKEAASQGPRAVDPRWVEVSSDVGGGRSASSCRHRWAKLQQADAATWKARKGKRASYKVFVGNAAGIAGSSASADRPDDDAVSRWFSDRGVSGGLRELQWLRGKCEGSCFAECSGAAAMAQALELSGRAADEGALAAAEANIAVRAVTVSGKRRDIGWRCSRRGDGLTRAGCCMQAGEEKKHAERQVHRLLVMEAKDVNLKKVPSRSPEKIQTPSARSLLLPAAGA
jgi:hypothetical protein